MCFSSHSYQPSRLTYNKRLIVCRQIPVAAIIFTFILFLLLFFSRWVFFLFFLQTSGHFYPHSLHFPKPVCLADVTPSPDPDNPSPPLPEPNFVLFCFVLFSFLLLCVSFAQSTKRTGKRKKVFAQASALVERAARGEEGSWERGGNPNMEK